MAIERIWQAGFESGKREADNWTAGAGIVSGTAYTGDWSMRVPGGNENARIVVEVPSLNQLNIGFFLRPGSSASNARICSIYTGTASLVFSLDAYADGELRLFSLGSLQDQHSFGYDGGVWTNYGIDIKFDSSSGWIRVYKDGSQILSHDGNTGGLVTDNVILGTIGGGGDDWVSETYYDDCYIDNTAGEGSPTAPRIKRFYFIKPNANGNYSQWMGSDGNQVDNYLLVNEQPANDDTTYVEATTGTLVDSYGMSTFTLDANEDIIAMIPFAIAKRANITEQIALGTRSSGTDSVGSDQDLTLSYDTGYVWERQVTGSLGAPWNQSYMDSVEVMIRSAGTY
jgi:hypothetical protein